MKSGLCALWLHLAVLRIVKPTPPWSFCSWEAPNEQMRYGSWLGFQYAMASTYVDDQLGTASTWKSSHCVRVMNGNQWACNSKLSDLVIYPPANLRFNYGLWWFIFGDLFLAMFPHRSSVFGALQHRRPRLWRLGPCFRQSCFFFFGQTPCNAENWAQSLE